MVRVTLRGPVEHAIVDVEGELDFSDADDVVLVLSDLPHRITTIDVSALKFIDVAGSRALQRIVDMTVETWGSPAVITGMSPVVARTLELAGSPDLVPA